MKVLTHLDLREVQSNCIFFIVLPMILSMSCSSLLHAHGGATSLTSLSPDSNSVLTVKVKEESYPESIDSLENLHQLIKSKYQVKSKSGRKVDSTATISFKSENKSESYLATHMQFGAGKNICFKDNGMAFALLDDLKMKRETIDWGTPSMLYFNSDGQVTGIGYFQKIDGPEPPPLPPFAPAGSKWFIHVAGFHPPNGGFIPYPEQPKAIKILPTGFLAVTDVGLGLWHPAMWDLHIFFPLAEGDSFQVGIENHNESANSICPKNSGNKVRDQLGASDPHQFFCYPDEDEKCAQFVPHVPCPKE